MNININKAIYLADIDLDKRLYRLIRNGVQISIVKEDGI